MTKVDDVVAALRRADTDGTLVVHYVPELELASGAIVGMQALPRVEDPGRGLLWPADFLSAADGAGLLPQLGWSVLGRCVSELSAWQSLCSSRSAPQRQLWVSVAVAQLLEVDFAERLADMLNRAHVPDGALGLVVGEAVLATGRYAEGLLQDLSRAGVALAVDGVTAWYPRLASLADLPIEAVTLDRGYVRGAGNDLAADHVVASLVDLAHAHGMRVVAEGVESWSEGARLCELDCDRAVGYLFSGPQRPEAARRMLTGGAGWIASGRAIPSRSHGRSCSKRA